MKQKAKTKKTTWKKLLLLCSFSTILLISFLLIPLISQAAWSFVNPAKTSTSRGLEISTKQFNKKVYLLTFNPTLSNGQSLTTYKGWNDSATLATQYIDWVKTTSGNRVNYEIAKTRTVSDGDAYMPKEDGFRYTQATLFACLNDSYLCHFPDTVNYTWIVNTYGLCDKLNAGQIDEVWLMAYPYGGFYESRLAGPNGYFYNSNPLTGTSCNKLLPIMGFSYERGVSEMVEDLGHRTEATMTKVYQTWDSNSISHTWNRFTLQKNSAPSFNYDYCGKVHFAPNSVHDYDWANTTPVESACDDFYNYPNLSENPTKRTMTCSEWGCSSLGFFTWWYDHMPKYAGASVDGKSNDWWEYIIDPNAVYTQFTNDPTVTVTPTVTATLTATSTETQSFTLTPTLTITTTETPTVTDTSTPTRTETATETATATATETWTVTETSTSTPVHTATNTITSTPTNTQTSTSSTTATASETNTETATSTSTNTATTTQASTRTATQTMTISATATTTASVTASLTATQTKTNTLVATITATSINTATPTSTPTNSATLIETTSTSTITLTNTAQTTSTNTITSSPTLTNTPTQTPLFTVTATNTVPFTATPTSTTIMTTTFTDTASPSVTLTSTLSPTPTQTVQLPNSGTATITSTRTPTMTATAVPLQFLRLTKSCPASSICVLIYDLSTRGGKGSGIYSSGASLRILSPGKTLYGESSSRQVSIGQEAFLNIYPSASTQGIYRGWIENLNSNYTVLSSLEGKKIPQWILDTQQLDTTTYTINQSYIWPETRNRISTELVPDNIPSTLPSTRGIRDSQGRLQGRWMFFFVDSSTNSGTMPVKSQSIFSTLFSRVLFIP
ncbi:MAG: hypothetical protein WCP97_07550 [bacterium]